MKLILFVSSYAPLFIIFTLKIFEERKIHWDVLKVSILLGILVLIYFITYVILLKIPKKNSNERTLLNVTNINDQVYTNYLVSFFVPLVSLNIKSSTDFVIIALILPLMFGIFVQGNMIFLNPLLFFLGYKIYKAKINSNNSATLASEILIITKKEEIDFERNNKVNISKVNRNLYLDD